jgi:hypothetical protein
VNLRHTFDVYGFDDAWSRLTELGYTEATAFIMLGRSIAEGWDENDNPSAPMETVRVEFDMDAREQKYFAITEGLLWTRTSPTSS